jgi:hypothetical protein
MFVGDGGCHLLPALDYRIPWLSYKGVMEGCGLW